MKTRLENFFHEKGMRISKEAKKEFSKLLKNKAKEYAQKLIKIAKYSGRKTIKKEDFKRLEIPKENYT